jgi:dipeptidyl aminopeptidase/acylaminoacyl peptidase
LDPVSRQPTVAPYGTWPSPITAELVAQAGIRLTEGLLANGTAWWLEGRPAENGRVVLMKADSGEQPVDVTPADFNLRTMVHEYGGGAYAVHEGAVFCSRFDDQRLYRIDPGSEPIAITPAAARTTHRYADGRISKDGAFWIGVRERHEGSGRANEVINELVAIPTGGGEPRIIAGGRDFYSNPRISPDGRRLSFVAWDLPWMPWDGCEAFVSDLAHDGTLDDPVRVAGRDGEESIWQPEWSPDGDLVFASDRSGWWNLERLHGNRRTVVYEAKAEFGYPAWVFGTRSFSFLGDGRIVCCYESDGRTLFAVVDPELEELQQLGLAHDALWRSPYVSAEGSTVLVIAGSSTTPNQVVLLDVADGSTTVLRHSAEPTVGTAHVSVPRAIEFPTEGDLTAHALAYPPTNPDFVAPDGEVPPLIVMSHGGPTSVATAILDLETQFWTSRGFAVVDVNYGGSTGYGRTYRERLNGEWGVVDLQDCVNAARYLVERGQADGERLLIRGSSAGGYTTICALTFTDGFAAGTTYYGVADLEAFAKGDGQKFELEYENTLVGPYPEAAELYRARSPINFAERISTPMLVLQGSDDEVVPASQAELIVAALRERKIPHAYLLFEGEGHGFRRAETVIASLEAELSFYIQILGLEPGELHTKLAIEHFS